MFSFGHCPNYLPPPTPNLRNLYHFIWTSKMNVSDNCGHNFGTFDDYGVKNDQKVSNDMIFMPKYKGKLGWKKGLKKFGQGPPPPFRAMPGRRHFFSGGLPFILHSYLTLNKKFDAL